MNFPVADYPWAVVEYINFDEPLVEAVPTTWLYSGTTHADSDGNGIVKALSYWPKQVSQVESFRKNMRSPGGVIGKVDKDLWEDGHQVVVLDFCESSEVAKRHRDRAIYTDHLSTEPEAESKGRGRPVKPPSRYGYNNNSDSEEGGPPIKMLAIQKKGGSQKPTLKKGSSSSRIKKRQRIVKNKISSSESDSNEVDSPSVSCLSLKMKSLKELPVDKEALVSTPPSTLVAMKKAFSQEVESVDSAQASPLKSLVEKRQLCLTRNAVKVAEDDRSLSPPCGQDHNSENSSESTEKPHLNVNAHKPLKVNADHSDEETHYDSDKSFRAWCKLEQSIMNSPPDHRKCESNMGSPSSSVARKLVMSSSSQETSTPFVTPSRRERSNVSVSPSAKNAVAGGAGTSSMKSSGNALIDKMRIQRASPGMTAYLTGRKAFLSPNKKSPAKAPSKHSAGTSMPATKKDIMELKALLNKNHIVMNKIWLAVAPPMETGEESVSLPKLPVCDLEAMDTWENFINDQTNFMVAVNCLVSVSNGHQTIKAKVYAMVKYLINDKVLCNFNMHGRLKKNVEQKLGFLETTSFKLIKVAIKKDLNLQNKGKEASEVHAVYSSEDIKKHCGQFLKDAPQRYQNSLPK